MTPYEAYLERMRRMAGMTSPFGPAGLTPSPMGPQSTFFDQNPWNDFQFTQNPNSMTPPQMGIGEGGVPLSDGMGDFKMGGAADLAAGGGANWGAIANMAGKALGGMGAKQEPMAPLGSLPGVGSGSHIRQVNAEYVLPLLELMRGAGRGRK